MSHSGIAVRRALLSIALKKPDIAAQSGMVNIGHHLSVRRRQAQLNAAISRSRRAAPVMSTYCNSVNPGRELEAMNHPSPFGAHRTARSPVTPDTATRRSPPRALESSGRTRINAGPGL
jgi:hypothetical protein